MASPLRYCIVLAALLLPGGLAGLGRAADDVPKRPYLLHLNGIGGDRKCDHLLLEGLKEGGFDAEMEIHDWTRNEDALVSLRSYDRNRNQKAKAIAAMIEKVHRADPRRPIILSSHSGGTAIAAWALESLPEDVKVETWLLFASALSPDYDLSKALAHVDGRAHAFSSPLDGIILGAGTRRFGTMDRKKVDAAGLHGFVKPLGADEVQYAKLIAHPYKPMWFVKYANAGIHISPLMAGFSQHYVAVLLKTGEPPADEGVLALPAAPRERAPLMP